MKRTLLIVGVFAVLAAAVSTACKKTKETSCEDYISETAPNYIYLKFIDTQTGANLLTSNNLTTEEVKISIAETPEPVPAYQWRINTAVAESSPFYGTIQLIALPGGQVGEHIRKIKAGNLGTVTLGYKISKKEITEPTPCSAGFYYAVSDVVIKDREFEQMTINANVLPHFLVVKF